MFIDVRVFLAVDDTRVGLLGTFAVGRMEKAREVTFRAEDLLRRLEGVALEGNSAVLVDGGVGLDLDVGLGVGVGAVGGALGQLLDLDGGRIGAGNLLVAVDF